tara:strand:+ start:2683 stop:3519 length:837 start_codon:yes stop_codon:yes gene_type:complete
VEKNDDLGCIYINNERHTLNTFSDEKDFEDHIKDRSEFFFKDCFVYDFKYTLKTNNKYSNNVKADLLVINKHYRYWAIVEVEYYSTKKYEWLSRHVVPQMNKITSINYADKAKDIFRWVIEKNEGADLNEDRSLDLMKRNKPFFFVVLNLVPRYPKQWITALFDCDIYVFKTYVNFLSKPVFVKESLKSTPYECRLVRTNNMANRWLIERPSLFLKNEVEFAAHEVDEESGITKNIVKFKLSENSVGIATELTQRLSSSSYRMFLNGGRLEICENKNR